MNNTLKAIAIGLAVMGGMELADRAGFFANAEQLGKETRDRICTNNDQKFDVCAYAQSFVKYVQPKLPQVSEHGIHMIKVEAELNKLRLTFDTKVPLGSDKFNIEGTEVYRQITTFLKRDVVAGVCDEPSLQHFLLHGGEFTYTYLSEEGVKMFEFDFDRTMNCSKVKEADQ